jgi:hypothetical protein
VGATAGRTGTSIAGSTIGVMSSTSSRDGSSVILAKSAFSGLSLVLVGSSPGSLLASTGAGGESGGADVVLTALANAVGWQNKFASSMPRERVSCWQSVRRSRNSNSRQRSKSRRALTLEMVERRIPEVRRFVVAKQNILVDSDVRRSIPAAEILST